MNKRDLFLSMLVLLAPIGAVAQDDMYFGSDTKAQKADEAKVQEAQEQAEAYYRSRCPMRDVDEYNRAGRLHSYYQKIGKDSLGNDIIQFQAGDGTYNSDTTAMQGNDDDYCYSRRMGRFDDFYGWYDPYFYSYRSPWSWGWYSPWYYGAWYDPWYYDWYWPYGGYYGWYNWNWGWPYYGGWGGWWGPTYYSYRNGGNLGGADAFNGRIAHGGNAAFNGRGSRTTFGSQGHSFAGARQTGSRSSSTVNANRGFRGSRANQTFQGSRDSYTPSRSYNNNTYSAPTRSYSGGTFSGGGHSFGGGFSGGGGSFGGGGGSFGGGRIGGHR